MEDQQRSTVSGKGIAKIEKTKVPLPTIQELYSDIDWAGKQNDLNRLLSQPPAESWKKEHPFIKGLKYLPIERVEWLLTSVFLRWWVEVKSVQVVANSVVVCVRVFAIDPITLETLQQDGVGAVDIQTKKDAPATDFNQILPFAVMKAVPAAKSYAVKDAAELWGKIFGKDISKKDFIAYENLDSKFDFDSIPATQDQCHELYDLIRKSTLDHEQRDEFVYRVQKGPSISEYRMIKDELLHYVMSLTARLQAGETLSQGEISKVVKARMNDGE